MESIPGIVICLDNDRFWIANSNSYSPSPSSSQHCSQNLFLANHSFAVLHSLEYFITITLQKYQLRPIKWHSEFSSLKKLSFTTCNEISCLKTQNNPTLKYWTNPKSFVIRLQKKKKKIAIFIYKRHPLTSLVSNLEKPKDKFLNWEFKKVVSLCRNPSEYTKTVSTHLA